MEQRKFARIGMRLNLSYAILGTNKLGQALTKDISAGGVRFIAEHSLQPGTRLEMAMRLPERDEPVRFLAEVIWSKPVPQSDKTLLGSISQASEVGVQFAKIDPKTQRLLMQYAALYATPPAP